MAEGRGDSRRGGAASQSSGTGRSTPETARQSPGIAGRKGTVALLIATGVLWSLGGVFIKTTDAHPLTISALRSLAAAAAMFAILLGRPRFLFSKVQIVGALSYAATLTLFVAANKLTTAANAILLQYTSPVFVALLCWLVLREKLRWYDFASIGGVALGLVLLLSGGGLGQGSALGGLCGILSGACLASFTVALRLHKNGSQVETILLGNLVAVLVGLPFLLAQTAAPQILRQFALTSQSALAPLDLRAALPPLLFLGVFQIAVPYAMFAKASESASALDLALMPVIEPLLNPLWVFLVTGERPAALTFVGGGILLGVVVLRSLSMMRDAQVERGG